MSITPNRCRSILSAKNFLSAHRTCRTPSKRKRACRQCNTLCNGESARRKVFWSKRRCPFRTLKTGSNSMATRTFRDVQNNASASRLKNIASILPSDGGVNRPARFYKKIFTSPPFNHEICKTVITPVQIFGYNSATVNFFSRNKKLSWQSCAAMTKAIVS